MAPGAWKNGAKGNYLTIRFSHILLCFLIKFTRLLSYVLFLAQLLKDFCFLPVITR